MLKLNNRGWGLAEMIGFLGILLLALLVVALLAHKYGNILGIVK